jgi:tRNA(His) guanylyltransferase
MASLGDRMKTYEKESMDISQIDPSSSYILRLDGSCFSKFTKPFKKPFDDIFLRIMINTTKDLLQHTKAVTAYTHSDEITLVFDKAEKNDDIERVHIYNGRVFKIISLTAGYCSARFNYWLQYYLKDIKDATDDYYDKRDTINRIAKSSPCFDCRLIVFPNNEEIVNHMIWRSIHDCYRNCIQGHGQHKYGPKNIFGLNNKQIKDKLYTDGINIDEIPLHYRYGTFIKRVLLDKEITFFNKKTKKDETIDVKRSSTKEFSIKLDRADDVSCKLIMSKYYDET